jgi:putative ABC transport system permease protein
MPSLSAFLRLAIWFTARHIRRHPWRLLAVLVGIALGAAVFTSVRLAVDASLDTFIRGMDLLSGKADWAVVKPGGRVPEKLVAPLLAHPAVDTASPLLTSYVQISQKEQAVFLLIGLDPILDHPLRTWQASASQQDALRIWLDLLRTPGTLIMGRRLARRQGIHSGDSVPLEHVNQVTSFRVIGILEPQGLARLEGGNVAITDIATLQEFTGTHGRVDRIDLKLNPDASPEDLARLRASLPEGIILEPPAETKETGKAMIRAYQINLSVLSFVSLFVGMFLLYSLVSINAASRRGELAVLRSLGGSSRLVFALVLSEGCLLGILGWLLAVPVGAFLVKYLVKDVNTTVANLFVRVQMEGLRLNPWEILLSFTLTLVISALAAYRPARGARGIAPKEAMTTHEVPERGQALHWILTLVGLGLILLTWPMTKLPASPGLPLSGYAAVFSLVAGFSLLSPGLLRYMGMRLPPVLARLAGQPAFLAARYVRDAGERTVISVGALVTAMALFVALATMVYSFRETVTLWVNQTLVGDVFVRPKMAGINQYRDPLPQTVVDGLKALSAGTDLVPYQRVYLRQGRISFQLEAVRFDRLLKHAELILLSGNAPDIRSELAAGKGVIVSEVFANQTGLGRGDRFRAAVGGVRLDAPILGVFRDYHTQGGVVHMDLGLYQRLTGNRLWSGVRICFTDRRQDLKSAAERLRTRILNRFASDHPLEVASGPVLRRDILRIFDETFAVTTILLLIALVVAGLGITTTLTVMVLERVRQLNTLAAVGASKGQIRTMIFWEAVLMVVAGEGMGLVCGLALAYLLIYGIHLQSFGWTFLYRVDWNALVLSLPLILGTALVAALPAARLVIRSSPATVLKEH